MVGSTTRTPVNVRHRQVVERDRLAVRPGLGEGEQRAALLGAACCSRSRSCSARLRLGERFGPLGVEQVGHHADDPGGVEHVHGASRRTPGAIRTAVCCRDVVAPPISSGSFRPRRCISAATATISSSDGVIRPDSPTASAPSATAVSRIFAAGTITPRSITS